MKRGLWWGLIFGVALAIATVMMQPARSQQFSPPFQYFDPAQIIASENTPPGQPNPPQDELAARVAELEKALADIKARDAAATKKAANKFSVNVGGRIYVDSVFFGQGAGSIAQFGDAEDTVQLRSARLWAAGHGFDIFDYKIEVDFAGRSGDDQQTTFKDVYMRVNDLPWLNQVQIGHFKEPLSMEELTSANNISLMERSLLSAFVPCRNVGIASYHSSQNERLTFAFGGFRDIGDHPPYVADDDGGYAFTTRVTYLPWYDEATLGRGLLHLGLGYSYRDVDNPEQRIAARAETAVGPYIVDTSKFFGVEDYQLLNPEIAFVYGPFSVQSEYLAAFYNRSGFDDPTFHGAYVQTGYFLTGEQRLYNRKKGVFERIKPIENFFRVRTGDGEVQTGWGAWELVYRYSWIDLDDMDVLGGTSSDHSFGLNWYWNPYMRLMFNYVHAQVGPALNAQNADFNVFEMRAQVDF